MAMETMAHPPQRSFFDRAIDLSRVNLEIVAYVIIIGLSVVAHLWNLGAMALHHDESIHAWASWRFYTGRGEFTCAFGNTSPTYCYDPVYHGPALYIFTLVSYFLFGAGDAQARLPMAVAGIVLVASCWWLRPYLGRRGALIAAVLLGFSPALLYYTRFARHDGLMVLWELWMVIGIFRFLDTGRAGYLYLLAAGLALAVATHELYYILFFIFGIVLLVRLLAELLPKFSLHVGLGILVIASALITATANYPLPIGEGLYLGEKTLLILVTVGLTWAAAAVWDPRPVLVPRFVKTWREQPQALLIAAGILVGIYLVMYTTFFAYPRGAIDGLYAGLSYWLGSQQDFARGDQPWYYYFMHIGLYEPLGFVCGIGAALYLFTNAFRFGWRQQPDQTKADSAEATADSDEAPAEADENQQNKKQDTGEERDTDFALPESRRTSPAGLAFALGRKPGELNSSTAQATPGSMPLFPLVMVIWYFSAIVIFSWAGEKMPWLVTHIALPGNLVAAWVLGRLLHSIPPLGLRQPAPPAPPAAVQDSASAPAAKPAAANTDNDHRESLVLSQTDDPRDTARTANEETHGNTWRILLIPPLLLMLIVALAVSLWRFSAINAEGLEGQGNMLQGFIALLVFGACVFALLTIAQFVRMRVVLSVAALTLAVIMGAYMLRATWLTVYTHPDVAIEPMVYTQTSPDIPRYVDYIEELAINQTRNYRTADDETGGLSMPIILSSNDTSGDGSLAWPMQWYLRDFQRLVWKSGEELRDPSPNTFDVQLPDGSTGPAPALVLFKPHVTDATRDALEGTYVQPLGDTGVFNWWFPEGDKCNPNAPGYKRFYLNSWMTTEKIVDANCPESVVPEVRNPLAPFLWPFLPDNIGDTLAYAIFRELPADLSPGARYVEFWVRADLVSGATATGGSMAQRGAPMLQLLPQVEVGSPDIFNNPTGIAIDNRGTIYVADTQNHRVLMFASDGDLVREMGGLGSGEGQFNEPRGLAVDDDGNLYVADTWNARIVKIDEDGDWVTTWGTGSEDMGGGRVATMLEGDPDVLEANPLGFFGPRGIAINSEGHIYIADTGNKRIVVTDDEGDYLYQWGQPGSGPGAFNEPTGIAIDGRDNVYVADTWNGRVQAFETGSDGVTSAVPYTTWAVPGWKANTYDDPSIAASLEGQVYVSVPAEQHVLATGANGEVYLGWGGRGDSPATLNTPSGIAVGTDGTVYVVDRGAARVRGFELPEVLPVSTP